MICLTSAKDMLLNVSIAIIAYIVYCLFLLSFFVYYIFLYLCISFYGGSCTGQVMPLPSAGRIYEF